MAFIKTHLISLLSGVAALAFISIAVLGMMSDGVEKKMQQRAGIANDIRSLKSNPKNQESIEAEAKRGQQFEQEYEETFAVAAQINRREVLRTGVFPSVESDAAAYYFRDAYKEAIQKLPRGELFGGDLPSDAEVRSAAEDIAELVAQQKLTEEEGKTAPDIKVAAADRPRPGPGGSMAGVSDRAGTYQAADPTRDPRARANVTKARSIRCYVSTRPDATDPTFHISPIWNETARPTPDEMWYAQVGLWVQQDVVKAVAELNDEAARKLKPDDAHVENMPVKRLEAIRVMGYWTEDFGAIQFSSEGRSTGGVPLNTDTSFTGRASDNQFDVIRFTVVVVVDQRELPRVIDQIVKQNFYELIEMSYEAVTLTDADYQEGYLYGAAPVVRATLGFEGYMARSVYEELFPAEVRLALGIAEPQGKKGRRP